MKTFLINLKKMNIKNLKKFPSTKYNKSVILETKKNNIDFLDDNISKYINGYAYIVYYKNKCEITEIYNIKLDIILKILEKNKLSNLIFISIPLRNKNIIKLSDKYLSNGFGYPFICNETPLGIFYKDYCMCLVREKNKKKNCKIDNINYVLDNFNNNSICKIEVKFDKKTCKEIKKLIKMGKVDNNGNIIQKEIAGRFIIKNMKNNIYILTLDEESKIIGDNQEVDVCKGLYNFHTHPLQAYIDNNVSIAWPSCDDLLVFLESSIHYETIFHTTITKEGLYFISLNKNWIIDKKILYKEIKEVEKFVRDKYDACHITDKSIKWYINKIHKNCYKGFPLFNIKYIKWENINKKHSFYFRKQGVNCITSDTINEILD